MGNSSVQERPRLPVICGPTAVGKTALGVALSEHFPFEVVSADSRQVYRQMDIGTAKPTTEEQQQVTHHLIDVVDPDQEFDAARYADLATACIGEIIARGHQPLLVGGTGLYIRALTEGLIDVPGADDAVRERLNRIATEQGSAVLHARLGEVDPVCAERLHPNDRVRIVRALEVYELTGRPLSAFQREHGFADTPYQTLKLGLEMDRDRLYARIDHRAEAMFAGGLLEEARTLLEAGYATELKALQTIGYRQAIAVMNGTMSPQDALDDLKRATRRYAKQQMTWFRQDKSIIWVDSSQDFVTIRTLIEKFYSS